MNDKTRQYQITFQTATLLIYVPEKLSTAECNDLEAYFALILSQAKRRAEESISDV